MTGVLKTVNKLAVTPSEDVFDESIAKAIVASIDRHPNIDAEAVNIEVRQGVVTLTGTVPSWTAYHDALGTARRTVGVVNVINNLSYGQNSQE
jgi:osmotically-inducible protein OsmY